ncbi:MAG: peptidase E [Oscillospiraceae bacterium]|nr:peptidase E [Oscillospiraceae bacterium]
MGRVVAIGGGELDTTHNINKYIVELTGKKRTNLLFIGTASHDAEDYISAIRKEFESLGCAVSSLSLTTKSYDDKEINSLLSEADIIYVGGGDTRTMMQIWKQYSLDKKLKEIYENDLAVLAGLSAGAICWFRSGHSDSNSFDCTEEWEYIILDGMLGLYPYCLCPHYNEEGRDTFDFMVSDLDYDGLALENDTAFVEVYGKQFFIGTRKGAKAWLFTEHKKQELEVIPC